MWRWFRGGIVTLLQKCVVVRPKGGIGYWKLDDCDEKIKCNNTTEPVATTAVLLCAPQAFDAAMMKGGQGVRLKG